MKQLNPDIAHYSLAYIVLPECMLDCFDIVGVEETALPEPDPLMRSVLNIYLDEKDMRSEEEGEELRPNGFTGIKKFEDYPIRARYVVLHVRRRRWLDREGHNVQTNSYPLNAQGTGYSEEFGAFLKRRC